MTVSATSPIIGCTLSTARLTERFGTTVVGRARAGRPDGRLSDILLRAGDILILDASECAMLCSNATCWAAPHVVFSHVACYSPSPMPS